MNNWKFSLTLVASCTICLTTAPAASADFVGVTTAFRTDPDTEFLCAQGKGPFVPVPLTVCNVYAAFDDPEDTLLALGNADLQVFNGAVPSLFYKHPFNPTPLAPSCSLIPVAPDLICDSFVTIGVKCGAIAPANGTAVDNDFSLEEFLNNGHIVGGWFNSNPPNGQGVAGYYPDLQVLVLQSSVLQVHVLSGVVDLFWAVGYTGDVIAELAVPVECEVDCPDDYPCDDGDACTQYDVCANHVCTGEPIDCDDGNPCTDDSCIPDQGQCLNEPVPDGMPCDDGNACTVGGECMNGKCGGGLPVDCDDGDPCTDDGCDPANGCTVGPGDCDDNNLCTDDSCDPEVGCTHTPITCEDMNGCTDDSCDPASGCVFTPNDGPCDDGDLCTENDHCGEDGCVHGTPVNCGEGHSCDPSTGECVADQDPCECIDGRVMLCHVPPGNFGNGRTISVGCRALEGHLAHGDTCGPCQ